MAPTDLFDERLSQTFNKQKNTISKKHNKGKSNKMRCACISKSLN